MSEVKTSTASIDSLYQEHHGWLFRWLRNRLGCEHNAADIAQDTFLRLIRSHQVLDSIREPRAYLTTTAKRLITDRSRREVIEQAYLHELMLRSETLDGHPSPETTWQAIQALEAISQILSRVPVKAQQAFILCYLEGKTQVEAAEEIGVSSRTLRTYLVQVLVQCQQIEI